MSKATTKPTKVEETKTENTVKDSAPVDTMVKAKEEVKDEVIQPPTVKAEEPVKAPIPAPTPTVKDERTDEQKIVDFVNSRPAGVVKLNDFLKSLYPPISFNSPAQYMQIGESKRLKKMLQDLHDSGEITIVNNSHSTLGKPYHHGEQQLSANHNIATVEIFAQKSL